MYENFYNLKQQPFHITPDLRFIYLSETHKQALASMIYGIQKREGFVAIIGAVGLGKTTIVRAFLEKAASSGLKVIYLFHASVRFTDIVKAIYRDLDLELVTTDLIEMMNGLHLALIELHRQGKTIVLIIDEAQTMSIETLANLRMLSNLETQTEKLIQVVLVGQPELEELLEKDELRQLRQRIVVRSQIAPLGPEESYAYIAHRLAVAGLEKPTIFSQRAFDIIVKEAKGVPRMLNVLCNNALIAGFRRGKNPVTASIAREIVTAFSAKQKQPLVRRWKVAALAGVAVFLALLIAFFLSLYGGNVLRMLSLHSAKPEPVQAYAGRLPRTEPLLVPVPAAAAPPEPKGAVQQPGAVEPKAAIEPESPRQPKEVAEQKGVVGSVSMTRVVKPGDTLSGLIGEVYRVSPKSARAPSLVDLVKQHNPAIIDPDVISVGSVIRFPELPKEKVQSK